MALIGEEKQIESLVSAYVDNVNKSSEGVNDIKKLRDIYSAEFRKMIIDVIMKTKLTIPPGAIIVSGSAVTQTNAIPIIIENGFS